MEDIYDNLENYQDEKLINELQIENRELKIKLEEYSSAMAQLQTDFDKLNSEYKKLETNYSSLLKTARAEIERKSEMIKSLNIEKDTLVLRTLQRPPGNDFRAKTPCVSRKSEESSGTSSQVTKGSLTKERAADKDNNSHVNKRGNSTQDTPSEETVTTDKDPCEDNELRNHKSCIENDLTEPKEVVTEQHKRYDDINYNNITKKVLNRNKSARSQVEPIFSSDDDFEALDYKYSRFSPGRHTRYSVHHRSKNNKFTESLDSYDSCSKGYRNKTAKSPDNSTYKHEKYYSDRKHEKYHSDKYNMQRKENHQSRGEYSKHRVLRSPPTDKYNRSKSRDRRGNYDREHHRDYDRQSPHHYDNHGIKHKLRNDFNEPSCKRQKLSDHNRERTISSRESFATHSPLATPYQQSNTNSAYTMESQHNDKDTKTKHTVPIESTKVSSQKFILPRNQAKSDLPSVDMSNERSKKSAEVTKELGNKTYMDLDKPASVSSLESGEIQSSMNCTTVSKDEQKISGGSHKKSDSNKNTINLQVDHSKSSGYKIPKFKSSHENVIPNKKTAHCSKLNIESSITTESQHADKETKDTNSTQKCITQKHLIKSELPVIDKPNDKREVDLPSINKFNDKSKKSADVTEELVNEVYMDLDESKLNSSLEEGEIPSSTVTKDCLKLDEQKTEGSHQKYDNIKIINDSQVKHSKSSEYKIPKSDSNKITCNSQVKHSKLSDHKIKSASHENRVTDKRDNFDNNTNVSTSTSRDFKENTNTSVNVGPSKSNGSNSIQQNYPAQGVEENINFDKDLEEVQNISFLSKDTISMNTLAGDLELSDEASDNRDSHTYDSKSKHIKKTKKKLNNHEEESNLNLNKNENELAVCSLGLIQGEINIVDSKEKKTKKSSDKKSPKDTETKHKSRKKTETNCSKSKKTNKDGQERKHKNKECKEVKSQQTINKFTDLFGDSCSLITPDDLGMPLHDVKVTLSDNVPYVPIFDNTQDAVDLNVKELTKEKSDSTIINFEIIKENTSKDKSSDSISSIVTKEDGDNDIINKQPFNNLYENTLSQTLNDGSNVVKTIIISTGVQPHCILDNNLTIQSAQNDGANNTTGNIDQSNVKKSSLNKITALATSTPHKTSSELPLPKEPNATVTEVINISSNISSNLEKVSAKNETDEPDVRIFVKRRRKVIKKA